MTPDRLSGLIAASAVVALAVGGLVVAERRRSRWGKWLCKPLASAGFVAGALVAGGADSRFGRAVLVALALSWLGDVLLISTEMALFRAGLFSFLAGHVAFATAFVLRGVSPAATAAALGVLGVVGWQVARWLLPHVEAGMRAPVIAYVVVICSMVSLAVGTVAAAGRPLLLVAATAFFLSDLSVARDRFVVESWVNRLWGLPLYYAAQLAFAWSLLPAG